MFYIHHLVRLTSVGLVFMSSLSVDSDIFVLSLRRADFLSNGLVIGLLNSKLHLPNWLSRSSKGSCVVMFCGRMANY